VNPVAQSESPDVYIGGCAETGWACIVRGLPAMSSRADIVEAFRVYEVEYERANRTHRAHPNPLVWNGAAGSWVEYLTLVSKSVLRRLAEAVSAAWTPAEGHVGVLHVSGMLRVREVIEQNRPDAVILDVLAVFTWYEAEVRGATEADLRKAGGICDQTKTEQGLVDLWHGWGVVVVRDPQPRVKPGENDRGVGGVPYTEKQLAYFAERYTVFLASDGNFDKWGDPETGLVHSVGVDGCSHAAFGDRWYFRNFRTNARHRPACVFTHAGRTW
jgi:hypothetical protein